MYPLLAAVMLFGCAVGVATKLRANNKRHRGGIRRSMSFNSEVMLKSFPAKSNMPPPIINILYLLAEAPSEKHLVETLRPLLKFDRFNSTVREISPGSGTFEFVELQAGKGEEGFELAQIVKTMHVNGEADMRATMDRINGTDLEGYGALPPWCVYRFVNDGPGPSGILVRIHHVIGDGIALISALATVFKYADTGDDLQLDLARKMSGGREKASKNIKPGLGALLSSLGTVLGLAATPYDDVTPLAPADKKTLAFPSTPRRTVVFPTVRLDYIKALKNAAGVTVNDVLVTATTGAIRRFGLGKDASAFSAGSAMQNRMLLPVALPRSVDDPQSALRNKWAFASCAMPIGEETAKARLEAAAEATNALKRSPLVGVQYWVQSVLVPLLPTFLAQQTAYDIFSRHSLVFSNMPGPEEQCSVAGQPLLGLQIVFPNLVPQGLLLSYGGHIYLNLSLDGETLGDPAPLRKAFLDELRELGTVYGVACEDKDIFDATKQYMSTT